MRYWMLCAAAFGATLVVGCGAPKLVRDDGEACLVGGDCRSGRCETGRCAPAKPPPAPVRTFAAGCHIENGAGVRFQTVMRVDGANATPLTRREHERLARWIVAYIHADLWDRREIIQKDAGLQRGYQLFLDNMHAIELVFSTRSGKAKLFLDGYLFTGGRPRCYFAHRNLSWENNEPKIPNYLDPSAGWRVSFEVRKHRITFVSRRVPCGSETAGRAGDAALPDGLSVREIMTGIATFVEEAQERKGVTKRPQDGRRPGHRCGEGFDRVVYGQPLPRVGEETALTPVHK